MYTNSFSFFYDLLLLLQFFFSFQNPSISHPPRLKDIQIERGVQPANSIRVSFLIPYPSPLPFFAFSFFSCSDFH
jgi:hypothetical protein